MANDSWKLRLFASADLVDSTRFKADRAGGPSSDWAPVFQEFFLGFPEAIEREYATSWRSHFPACSEHLKPWKFSGDEVLLSVVLKDHKEVASHLKIFLNVLKSYPAEWNKFKDVMRLKGTCWLAGFPYTNHEIDLVGQNGTRSIRDFIGPSMDLGFRLTAVAEPKRVVLSADLAWMLIGAVHDAEIPAKDFELFYLGRRHLKGVDVPEGYPAFALGTVDSPTGEDALVSPPRTDQARQFLSEFLRSKGQRRPFIVTDPSPDYHKVPKEFEDWLNRQREVEQSSLSVNQLTADDPPASGEKAKLPLPGI